MRTNRPLLTILAEVSTIVGLLLALIMYLHL